MDLRLLRYAVAVADEGNIGRAATRLHMTQPPLSRAIRQLEAEVGTKLFERNATGTSPTAAGQVLIDEARTLLARAGLMQTRVAVAAGQRALTLGILGESAAGMGAALASAFRKAHSDIEVRIRSADFSDPSAGIRAGHVGVALTRTPFDTSGLDVRVLRRDSIGVVLREDDDLAGRSSLCLADLVHRQWFRFPDGTDEQWQTYWNGNRAVTARDGVPVVRTVQECRQAVLWNGCVGLSPLDHPASPGLVLTPLEDMPASELVIAWRSDNADPLVAAFVRSVHEVRG